MLERLEPPTMVWVSSLLHSDTTISHPNSKPLDMFTISKLIINKSLKIWYTKFP
jgi:hypothetical protein